MCIFGDIDTLFIAVHLLYINIGTYCRIRTYVYRYVLSNTYLRLLLWNIKIDKNDRKSISDNNLLNNNVNTVDLYQISPVILSSFLGIPSEFLGNRWQYYWRHLQKIHCILSMFTMKNFKYIMKWLNMHFQVLFGLSTYSTMFTMTRFESVMNILNMRL